MEGRDPHEPHRTATPLELLFDLTFVVAFGIAADELAHYVVDDHIKAGLLGFALATFSIIWAWINFSWFASAYDTDDWVYRLTTMVQMVGVIVLALGLPAMFESIDEGDTVDNRVMVAGYIVMRVAMVFQWERAARQDPPRKRVCRTYITTIVIGQAGWLALLLAETSIGVTFAWVVVLVARRVRGPVDRGDAHGRDALARAPHRRALRPAGDHRPRGGPDRHDRLADRARGAGGCGLVRRRRAVAVAGTALPFGMWWIYFIVPSAQILHVHRERSFGWGYGHIPLIGAVVGDGRRAAHRGLLPRGGVGARRRGDGAERRGARVRSTSSGSSSSTRCSRARSTASTCC